MCLWILTACLGLLPGNPSPIVVVPGALSPIIIPTAAPATTPAMIPTTASTPPATPAPTMPPVTTTPAPTLPPQTIMPTIITTLPPTTVKSSIGGLLVPLIICNNPEIVCVHNPNGITARSGVVMNMPPIIGYSAQLPSYDTAVKFPRFRRSLNRQYIENVGVMNEIQETLGEHNIIKRKGCDCIPCIKKNIAYNNNTTLVFNSRPRLTEPNNKWIDLDNNQEDGHFISRTDQLEPDFPLDPLDPSKGDKSCLGLLPGNPSPIVIAPGAPSPIIIPTVAPTPVPPTIGNITAVPTILPVTLVPTMASTLPPTTMPVLTTVTSLPPTTMPPMTAATTLPPTTMPVMTTVTTSPPTTMPPVTTPTVLTAATTFTVTPPTVTTLQPTIGPIPIDPRLGSTAAPSAAPSAAPLAAPSAAPSAAINMPPITGYNAQVPTYNSAVNFPRSRRSIHRKYIRNVRYYINEDQKSDNKHNIVKRQSCVCVTAGTCNRNSGAGLIDVRIVTPAQQCPAGQEYCCGGTTTPVTPINCGLTQTVPAPAVAPAPGQANFGEYPWQAIILTRQNDYIAGGVLVDGLNILTVTHRMVPYVVSGTAPNVKVRLGEWDAAGTYEPVPYQEYSVSRVFSHPSYNANTLQYDIMILRLASAVPFTPNMGAAVTINRACLPPSAATVYTGQRCMVSGWGKNNFGVTGQYQQILKKVDVPIVAPATCQAQLQAARLGASYVLDTTSFICAGGEANKDSCTGDGGSGLVCQVNGQWVVVGLVAWGLGCASANVPGVYVNVAALLPWIQQQIATP